jgi:FkbM family methyltransferase
VTKALRQGDVWEPNTIEYILQNIKTKNLVTCGAYIGDFLPAFCEIKKVFTYEPVRENYEFALRNIQINNLENTYLENCGLSDKQCLHQIIVAENGIPRGGGSSIVPENISAERNIELETVSLFTLDELLPPQVNIGIIHLDVENHEYYALMGAIETINKYRPILILENCNKKTERQLEILSYEMLSIIDGNTVLEPKKC